MTAPSLLTGSSNRRPPSAASTNGKFLFTRFHRNFCYLNHHKDHITLGFSRGWKLAPKPGILLGENENLKHLRYLEIFTVKDLCSARTQRILNEAIILDEMTAGKKSAFMNEKIKRAFY